MEASSVTHRLLTHADFRTWAWWRLPWRLRGYVGAVVVTALVMIGYTASQTIWTLPDLGKFLLLIGCGLVSVAATPRTAYAQGALVRDFITAWVLPVAILLRLQIGDLARALMPWRRDGERHFESPQPGLVCSDGSRLRHGRRPQRRKPGVHPAGTGHQRDHQRRDKHGPTLDHRGKRLVPRQDKPTARLVRGLSFGYSDCLEKHALRALAVELAVMHALPRS